MTDEAGRNVPDAVFVGRLQEEYILPAAGPARVNGLGGSLAYAAAAFGSWGGRAGMVARVSAGFQVDRLNRLKELGFNLEGVRHIAEPLDMRFFAVYGEGNQRSLENPISHFAERKQPFPPELMGYQPRQQYCSKTEYQSDTFRVADMPRLFLEASAAHISPIDFISHKSLPSVLKTGMISTLTMRACSCYMDPIFWEDLRGLVSDLTAFMMTDAQALRLFKGRSVDLWEIARHLAGYGPEVVLIHAEDGSTRLYDRLRQERWIIPACQVSICDPTGSLDAFDGGFLAGLNKTREPLEAALCGAISAAVAGEGSGPYFLLDGLPGLKELRLQVLRQQIIAV